MKFLRELITRKHQYADTDAIPDVALDDVEIEPDETSDAELFSNLASIQTKIQEALDGTKPGSGEIGPDGENKDKVVHFADAAADIVDPVTEEPELDQEEENLAAAEDENETIYADGKPEEDVSQTGQ